jgi:hypothetical protein
MTGTRGAWLTAALTALFVLAVPGAARAQSPDPSCALWIAAAVSPDQGRAWSKPQSRF